LEKENYYVGKIKLNKNYFRNYLLNPLAFSTHIDDCL